MTNKNPIHVLKARFADITEQIEALREERSALSIAIEMLDKAGVPEEAETETPSDTQESTPVTKKTRSKKKASAKKAPTAQKLQAQVKVIAADIIREYGDEHKRPLNVLVKEHGISNINDADVDQAKEIIIQVNEYKAKLEAAADDSDEDEEYEPDVFSE